MVDPTVMEIHRPEYVVDIQLQVNMVNREMEAGVLVLALEETSREIPN